MISKCWGQSPKRRSTRRPSHPYKNLTTTAKQHSQEWWKHPHDYSDIMAGALSQPQVTTVALFREYIHATSYKKEIWSMVTVRGGLGWLFTWPLHLLAKQLEWAWLSSVIQQHPLWQTKFYGQLKQIFHLESVLVPQLSTFKASMFLAKAEEEGNELMEGKQRETISGTSWNSHHLLNVGSSQCTYSYNTQAAKKIRRQSVFGWKAPVLLSL